MIDPAPGPPIDAVPYRRGDFVVITTDSGRELDAMITMASRNGRSLILMYDGMIGGWVGMLPAFQHDDGHWAALDNMPLQLRRKGGA